MTPYEIRIVRGIDRSPIVVNAKLMSDHAAVRRARMLAAEGDLVEVWRGLVCIYSTMPDCISTR